MSFVLQAEVKNAKNVGAICDVGREFFKNFNPKGYIKGEGKRAVIKVVFDEQHPPTEIMEALKNCEDENLEFSYVQVPEKTEPQQSDTQPKEEDFSEKFRDTVYTREDAISNLEEIAANSSSYEEFKLNIYNKWLGIKEKGLQLFSQTIEVAEVCDEINWKTIWEKTKRERNRWFRNQTNKCFQSLISQKYPLWSFDANKVNC